MYNRELLAQSRRGIRRQIEESPSVIEIDRAEMVSDGFGGMTPTGTVTSHMVLVRISHEQRGVQAVSAVPAGLDTDLTLWLLAEYDANVLENDTFEFNGRVCRVGRIDPLKKFEGVQAIQAPLYIGDTVATGLVTGVTLDQAGPVTITTPVQLVATVAPANAINTAVTWASSDDLVVTVDDDGLVTAVGPGTATVTVTTVQGSFTDTCVFEVEDT